MLTIKIQEKEYILPQGITVIGRGEDADITIDSTKLSRIHVRFYITADKIEIEDLGSKNGTFVNARRIEGKKELIKGDRVKLADMQCGITYPPRSPAQPASLPATPKPPLSKTAQRLARKQKKMIQNMVIGAVLVIIGLIVYSPIKNYLTKDQQEAQILLEQADSELSSAIVSEDIKTNNEVKSNLEILKKRLSQIPAKYEEEYNAAGKLIAEFEKKLNRIQAKNRELRIIQDVSAQYADIVKELDTGSLSPVEAISRLEHLISMCPGSEIANTAGTKITEISRIILEEERKEIKRAKEKARVLTVSLRFSEALLVINEILAKEYVRIPREEVDALNRTKKEIRLKAKEYFEHFAKDMVNKARTGDCAQLRIKLEIEYKIIGFTEFKSIFNEAAKRIDEINTERIMQAKAEVKKELDEIEKLEQKRMYENAASLYERLIPRITEHEIKNEIEKKKLMNDLYAVAKKNIIRLVNESGGIEIAALGHIKTMNEQAIELQMEDTSMPIGWDKIRDGEFLMLTSRAARRYPNAKLLLACGVFLLQKGDESKADEFLARALSASADIQSAYSDVLSAHRIRVDKRRELEEEKKKKKESTYPHAIFAPSSEKLQAIPTFHCIGLYWSPADGNENIPCEVNYRKTEEKMWKRGFPLWFDVRNKEYRGSLVDLEPDTRYEIIIGLAGAKMKRVTVCRTWNERFPVAKTVLLKETMDKTLVLRQSGKPDGYIVYTHEPGKSTIIEGNNSIDNCIEVHGSYVIIRGLTLKNPRNNGIELFGGVHDVIIEECDVSGWGQNEADGWGENGQSAVYAREKTKVKRIIVQRNKLHHPRSDSNSWKEYRKKHKTYHPRGPQAVYFSESGGNHVIRYNEMYSDADHYFNDILGAENNYSTCGYPNRDSDIYGNYLANCWDDAIESEGANCNVRIWGNFIEWTYVKIATATTSVGPLYIWRNVSGVARMNDLDSWNDMERGGFLKTSDVMGGGKIYVFHNTLLQPAPPKGVSRPLGCNPGLGHGGPMLNVTSRNNIFHVCKTGGTIVSDNNHDPTADYDYDLYNGNLNAAPGHEKNGLRRTPTYKPDPFFDRETGKGIFTLKPSGGGYDKGVIIPNFNDNFKGAGPDIGAHEYGTPPMEFGVNAYRQDEGQQ